MKKLELVRLFRDYTSPLPDDLLYLILEIAGLVRAGRCCCYFSINRNFFVVSKRNQRRKPWQRSSRLG